MTPEEEKLLRSKLISGMKWSALLRFATQAGSWLLTIVVVRFLTPQDYGLNAMLEVPIEILMLFTTLGLEMALIQKHEMQASELAAVFGTLLLVNGLFFVALILGASHISTYFAEPKLEALIQATAVIFLLSPFRTIPNALMDRDLEFKLRSQIDMVAMIVSSILSLILAVAGAGVWALVVALIANFVLRSVLLAYRKPWFIRPTLQIAQVKDLLYYGGVMTLSGAVLVVAGKTVNLITGPSLGAELLGYFAVAAFFAHLPMSKIMPIVQQTMYPAYARLREKTDMTRQYLLKSLEVSALIMFPMLIGLACIAEPFVSVVFGAKWLPMALPLSLLALVTPLRMVSQVCFPALNALGHARAVLSVNLFMLVFLCVGAFLAIGHGLIAVVVIWVLVVPCALMLTVLYLRRLVGVQIGALVKAVRPAALGSLVMGLPILTANHYFPAGDGLARLLIEVAAGATIYLLVIYIAFRSLFDEVRQQIFA